MASNTFSCNVLSILFLLISLISTLTMAASAQLNVTSYGANPDGKTDSSKAFLDAWTEACGSPGSVTIYVPNGTFLLEKELALEGPCESTAMTIRIDGTLSAPSDYKVLGKKRNWIIFRRVTNLTVSGGTIDGQGAGLWSCKSSHSHHHCHKGATSLEFSNSHNISIKGLTSLNSQRYHIVINECQEVKVTDVRVSAPGDSPNTDGIHVEESSGVSILNSTIGTGDDCISVGRGTTNLWVRNVACGPGHGISIGSLGKKAHEEGVEKVRVENCTFTDTQNGIRIKTWGRQSTGFVKNITYQNIVMNNVKNPIIIDQNYCPNNKNCPGQASGIKISDVSYEHIRGSSAKEAAVKLDCSEKNPCTGIKMEDVNLTYKNQPAEGSCVNVDGSGTDFARLPGCIPTIQH